MNIYKAREHVKKCLYSCFGITLPKIFDQREYWQSRGLTYQDDFFRHGYVDRELFYQNMLVDMLRQEPFARTFEAGCGFGWNIRRVAQEFPDAFVTGLDFSTNHLLHRARPFLDGSGVPVVNGDACYMPFADNAFDVGFTVGVFMNIHPDRIESALREMARVCAKRVIHFEWNRDFAPPALAEKRAHKTNISSHAYHQLYEQLGHEVVQVRTCDDFKDAFARHEEANGLLDTRGVVHEGYGKYILVEVALRK